jgi:hypothetical protein
VREPVSAESRVPNAPATPSMVINSGGSSRASEPLSPENHARHTASRAARTLVRSASSTFRNCDPICSSSSACSDVFDAT